MKIVNSIVVGLGVAILGFVFAGLFANVMNGTDYNTALSAGLLLYLSGVVAACTHFIVSKIGVSRTSQD